MRRQIKEWKNRIIEWYDILKALDEMPLRRILGDFYEEKETRKKKAPRSTKTRVEDLRPPS